MQVALESLWSRTSYKLVDEKLRERAFDVVHVQNFFPKLSPSVYAAARKHGVAVVQSLRNYRLLCPATTLYRNAKICEECLHKTFKYPGVMHGCYRNSVMTSAVVAAMTGIHSFERDVARRGGPLHQPVGEFTRKIRRGRDAGGKNCRQRECGAPGSWTRRRPRRIRFIRGPADAGKRRANAARGMESFGNELVVENRWRWTAGARGQIVLRPAKERGMAGTTRRGRSVRVDGGSRVARRTFRVVRAIWQSRHREFCQRNAVLASNMAAMAELVEDRQTGLLFRPGDSEDLAEKIKWAAEHREQLLAMRPLARRSYEKKYTVAQNCTALIAAYELARSQRSVMKIGE